MRTPNYAERALFVLKAREYLREKGLWDNEIDRPTIEIVCQKYNLKKPFWLMTDKTYRLDRGRYSLDEEATVAPQVLEMKIDGAIPKVTSLYVKFGHYDTIDKIIRSQVFLPLFVSGLSGNGKTMMILQIASERNREVIRVNITTETDEDDLLGGFRLVNGETVWQDGPVVVAMEKGAILLLDEIDLGTEKLMCLQPILEGNGVYLKKVNRQVVAKPGFMICATANTKGRGSQDGRFIGTNIMNESLLDRFAVSFDQKYPNETEELKILTNLLISHEKTDETSLSFAKNLCHWSAVTRSAFEENAIEDVISTRRLVSIVNIYVIFGSKEKAIKMGINRFSESVQNSFLTLYKQIDDRI